MSTSTNKKTFDDAEQAAQNDTGNGDEAKAAPTADDVVAMAKKAKASGNTAEKAAAWDAWNALPAKVKTLTGKEVAAALGVPVAVLRGKAEKGDGDDVEAVQLIKAHDLSPDPVDGAKLLDDIVSMLRRFLWLPPHAAETMALWAVHTHASVLEVFEHSGFLNLWSPTKQCGKSVAVEYMKRLCARVMAMSGTSNATLFRAIHGHRPTVILDEADKIFANPKVHADMIATINAGHLRGASVGRCVGDTFEVVAFKCFAPYLLAGIGDLPGTVADRSIPVPMQRKPRGRKLERRTRSTYGEVWKLGERAARWTADKLEELRSAAEAAIRPESLEDRACDNWEALFAIAAVAGGSWPARALTAALALSGERGDGVPEYGVLLLADLHKIFDEDRNKRDKLTTLHLLAQLNALPERPWKSWDRGEGLADRGLAGLLRPFGILSKSIRVDEETAKQSGKPTAKGYARAAFKAAWDSYPTQPESPEDTEDPPCPGSERHSDTTAKNTANPDFSERHTSECVTDSKVEETLQEKGLLRRDAQEPRRGARGCTQGESRPARDSESPTQAAFDLPQRRPSLDAFKAEQTATDPSAKPRTGRRVA